MLAALQGFRSPIMISKFLLWKRGSELIVRSANLVNNIDMLYVAARHIPAAVEKIAILKHLREIEDWTGWKTARHILELERLWGLG